MRSVPSSDEPGPDGLSETIGIEGFELVSEEEAVARLPVTDRIRQPFGIVHGGAFAALAETLTSRATWEVVGPECGAFGQANDTSFFRPISAGTVHARAKALHRGRTSWVWEVSMRDDEERLCSVSRMTIAVREIERD